MAKKQTRKQQIAEDTAADPFLETANRAAAWVEKRTRQILMVIVALAVLIAVALFVMKENRREASELTANLTEALDDYREASDMQKAMTSTVPAELSKAAEAALPKFEAIIDKDSASGVAHISRLYAADLARRAGQHAKAQKLYEEYLASAPKTDFARFLAIEGAGYGAEEQGNLDKAMEYFEQLTKLPSDFYKDYGYKHVGRIHELKKQTDKALAAYKSIVDDMPDSKLRDFADKRIAALE